MMSNSRTNPALDSASDSSSVVSAVTPATRPSKMPPFTSPTDASPSDQPQRIKPVATKTTPSVSVDGVATVAPPGSLTSAKMVVLPPSDAAPAAVPAGFPETYFDCHMADLTVMVASMLEEIVRINDALPFNQDRLTRFHSRSPPGISVKDYLVRIVKFCSLDKAILVVLLYFIDLLTQSYPSFIVTSLTVHRFIITSVAVASKGLCDSFCTNSHYAKVGGISQIELNLLEVEFLTRVDYSIVPKIDVLSQYYESMLQRHGLPQFRNRNLAEDTAARTPDTSDSRPTSVPPEQFAMQQQLLHQQLKEQELRERTPPAQGQQEERAYSQTPTPPPQPKNGETTGKGLMRSMRTLLTRSKKKRATVEESEPEPEALSPKRPKA